MAKSNKGRKFFATTATAALVASAIVPVASAAQINDFNSISSYAQEAVQDLNDRGVIKGDQKGNFNPKSAITRAEAATILTNALELEGSGSTSFTDVNKSAWYYDAIDAAVANGIFQGQGAGKFNPKANLTRSEAAIILVDAFGLEGSADLSTFKDSASVKSWAEEALSIAVANGVMKGDDNGNLKPNASITRQDFALMYYRTEAAEGTEEVSGSVKAINNTTVEVTFKDAVTDLSALNFAIEGLTISNKAIKQTDAKTVVLTTSAQTADVEYTVTVNGEAVGKFKGVSAVIPTAVDVTTKSIQGVLGKEVTVSAKVTVAAGQSAAGIPVTFNIPAQGSLANAVTAEAVTNADGVASYNYTRYTAVTDDVVAYATGDRTKFSAGKVYWATAPLLTVSEITAGNDLTNNTKKSYKVKGAKNTKYFVTVKENIGVTPDKVTKLNVQNAGSNLFVIPTELSTGGNNVVAEVVTDADGEATFTVHGANLTATPIVYDAKTVAGNVNAAGTLTDDLYAKTALQSEAPAVKYSQIDAVKLSVVAEGTAEAAEYATVPGAYNQNSVGGRTYTVTVTDKNGKLAPEGTVAYVTFEDGNIDGNVYFSTAKQNFSAVSKNTVKEITVGKEGKATFRLAGKGTTTFVKPTIFLNTAGSTTTPVLDKTDVQVVSDVTYFKSPVVKNAVLKVTDAAGKEITSATVGTDAYITYQSVDQNGFAYKPTSTNYQLAFDVTSTFGNAIVKDSAGGVLNANQNLGTTKTYQVFSNANGEAVIRVTATNADTVTVNATGANGILPTHAATVSFTAASTVDVATGKVVSINTTTEKFVIENATTGVAYTFSYDEDDVAQYQIAGTRVEYADFKAALSANDEIVATKTTDGKYILNIKANGTGAVTINSQSAFNQALANGETTFNLAITGGLTINTTATTTLNLTGTIAGGLTVNTPNAHINNTAAITGGVNIIDVAGSSFVNMVGGSIAGDVTITDSNARFENAGTFAGDIVFNGTGAQTATLVGTSSNNVVLGSGVTGLALTAGSTYSTITVNNPNTTVTVGGTPVTPGVIGGTGTTGEITLDAAEYVAGSSVKATVTLADADLDTNPAVIEKVTVKVTYGTATATDLVLTETGADTGEFKAYTQALTTAGDLVVSYTDVKTASGTIEEVKDTAVVYAGDVVKFTAQSAFDTVNPLKSSYVVVNGAQVPTTGSAIQAKLVEKLAELKALNETTAADEGRTVADYKNLNTSDINFNFANIKFSEDKKTVYITGPLFNEATFKVAKGAKAANYSSPFNFTLVDATGANLAKINIAQDGTVTIVTP